MELRQLRYFVVAAEKLNFSKAAQLLFISQPTLSLSISQLEESLGTKLFIRGKNFKTNQLTPAGEYLLPKAKELLLMVDEIETAVLHISGETVKPALKIGIDDKLDRRLLTQTLSRFHTAYPEVSLIIETLDSNTFSDALLRKKVDIGFTVVRSDSSASELQWDELNQLPLCLAVGSEYADSVHNDIKTILQEKTLYLVKDPHAQTRILSVLAQQGISPNVVTYADRVRVLTYVEAGLGVTIMHDSALGDRTNNGVRCISLAEEQLTIHVFAVRLNTEHSNPHAATFLSFYKDSIPR